MKLLAIDPGSHKIGVALFEDNKLIWAKTVATGLKDRYQRTRDILTKLMTTLETADPFVDVNRDNYDIVCEEPTMQGKANISMQRVLGGLEFLMTPTMSYIHPMTLKANLGSGTLDKLEIALAAGELLTTDREKDILAELIAKEEFDATDAVAIGVNHLRSLKNV